jgi:hypothetical protein
MIAWYLKQVHGKKQWGYYYTQQRKYNISTHNLRKFAKCQFTKGRDWRKRKRRDVENRIRNVKQSSGGAQEMINRSHIVFCCCYSFPFEDSHQLPTKKSTQEVIVIESFPAFMLTRPLFWYPSNFIPETQRKRATKQQP